MSVVLKLICIDNSFPGPSLIYTIIKSRQSYLIAKHILSTKLNKSLSD